MGEIADQVVTGKYALYSGDAMDVMAEYPPQSIDGVIYSPPFAYGEEGVGGAGLYKYSSSERDLSNAGGYSGFFEMYGFFVEELARITKPGRCNGVHCMETRMSNSGGDALVDFPGDVIRLHQRHGFEYLGRHDLWKEPLAVRNRTMIKDLTHQTIVDDCAYAGVATADVLLIFRRNGVNRVPVHHPNGFTEYWGATPVPADRLRYQGWSGKQTLNTYSQWIWRQYASAVWDDIRGNMGEFDVRPESHRKDCRCPRCMWVLPFEEARDEEDERHPHPLQLDAIRRFVDMRTNPGDTILSPFAGVGSEVYAAVELGRQGIGTELKPSYYRQAVKNMAGLSVPLMAEQEALL